MEPWDTLAAGEHIVGLSEMNSLPPNAGTMGHVDSWATYRRESTTGGPSGISKAERQRSIICSNRASVFCC